MQYENDQIISRTSEMKTVRAREEPAWRDLAFLFRPDEVDISQTDKPRDDSELYDATGLNAVDTFIGGMFGQATNPANRWMGLTLDDEDRARYAPNAEYLYRYTNLIFSSLQPAVSTFYGEMPSVFGNVGVFGNGYLLQEELKNTVSDRALSIGQCYRDVDAMGETNEFHRVFPLTGRQMKTKFTEAELGGPVIDNARYMVTHAMWRNYDYETGKISKDNKPWLGCYVSQDHRKLRAEGGFWELPVHYFGWQRRDGRPYCTGPGHNARPDAASLNEMERSHLVAGQFAAEPPMLFTSESTLTAADVVPNAALGGGVNEQGKQLVQILERKQQLQLTMAQSEQRRNAIRAAMFYSIMQLMARPAPMTAAEFNGYRDQMLELMAPNLVRIHRGLSSFIARRARILQRAGQVDQYVGPPPPELRGRIEIEYLSPLAKVQKSAKARGVLGYVQSMGQVAVALNDPGVMDNVDGDVVADVLHDAMTEVPGIRRDPRKVADMRAARAQAQQEQANVEKMAQAADVVANVSHAAQAQSLAQGRQQRP